jgi:hypothetical protein
VQEMMSEEMPRAFKSSTNSSKEPCPHMSYGPSSEGTTYTCTCVIAGTFKFGSY